MKTYVCCLAILLIATSCSRERRSTPAASESQRTLPIRVSPLQPGPKLLASTALENKYEGNSQAIVEGQRLFEQYNCSGCHAHGGGGIGPALTDEEWIYGSSPSNIYTSIAEGRPNGMPSWGGHIPDYQIWELVTYVRSLGGFESRVASPSRSDEMQAKKAEEP